MVSLATKRSTRPSSSRSAATTPSPRPSVVDDAGLGRHVDESAAVIAEDVVGQGGERLRRAVVVALLGVFEFGLAER